MIKRDPDCTMCKLHKTAEHVCLLGQGPEPCDIMIVGEAPGKREDDSGKPFVGQSGKLLEEVLAGFGISRRRVFITNAVSCRPPDNRTPSKAEIRTCKAWLDYQVNRVKPKYVLLLGNVPLLSVTGESGIKKRRGKPFEKDGIIYVPTYHPAFILRDPRQRTYFESDIRLFQEIINGGGLPRERNLSIVVVDTRQKFQQLLRDLKGTVSFDIETTCLYPWGEPIFQKTKGQGKKYVGRKEAKIVTIGFGTAKHQYIIPANHRETTWTPQEVEGMVKEISKRLEDCFLVAHNGKFDFLWMLVHYGVEWYNLFDFDTMIAHYLLDENDLHGLKYLAQKYCGAPDWEVDKEVKQGAAGTKLKQTVVYHAHDLYYTRELRFILGKMLRVEGDIKRVFDKILMPCSRLFTEVEFDGVCIDITKMDDAEKYLRGEIADAEKEMLALLKQKGITPPQNWGSRDQLAELLFVKLKIPPIDKTAKGKNSTSESVLMRIDHPIAGAIIKYRGAKQQLSFFIEGWKPFLVKHKDGNYYLHPSFKLIGTVTGRLSCEHPNLQQVPRDERIRSLIFAALGWVLLEADLSQIELRIAAELAGERHMLDAFARGIDVHWLTCLREIERGAGQKDLVLDTARTWKQNKKATYAECIEILLEMGADDACEINKEWKELRKKAKAINFGYLYGMWWKKFKIYARDNYGVTVTDEQAQASREFFFHTYSDYPKWHDRQKRYARNHGYVRTLSGRKRHLPAAQDIEDSYERAEAWRQAINAPVQSFANEINLMAALELRQKYGRNIVQICGTVHDSILARVKVGYAKEVGEKLLEIMKRPKLFDDFDIELSVPVLAEAKVGPWGAGISFDKWKKQQRRAA